MARKERYLLFLGSMLVGSWMSSCGSSGGNPAYVITGNSRISAGTCAVYTVTRIANVTENTTIQPGVSGSGNVYSDSNCRNTKAGINVQIPSGSKSTSFYFKASAATTTTLTITDLTTGLEASFTVTVQ